MRGALPGEFRKLSLVEVPIPMTSRAGIESQRDQHGEIPDDALARQLFDRYVVETRRLDGEWCVIIEYKGERWTLPHKVVEQLRRHCDTIISAARSDRARDAAQQRMSDGLVPFAKVKDLSCE